MQIQTVQNIQATKENKQTLQLLLANQQLLAQICVESKYRKNKNIMSPKMIFLVNKLERNLIKIAKLTGPQPLSDMQHVLKQKQRFLKFYNKRNGGKKINVTTLKAKDSQNNK